MIGLFDLSSQNIIIDDFWEQNAKSIQASSKKIY
jgi:hypothetical protein